MGTVYNFSQISRGGRKVWQHQLSTGTATDALAGPGAGATVPAHNVACTNGVWLHVSRAHESSCENDGNSSNTATSVVTMVLTALQAIARCMWGSYLAALGACHHATATHVVIVTGAAPNATALAVGIR